MNVRSEAEGEAWAGSRTPISGDVAGHSASSRGP